MKVARNEKWKKLLGFSFYTNIGNFEAFLRNLNLSTNHLFWRCVYTVGPCIVRKKCPKIFQIALVIIQVIEIYQQFHSVAGQKNFALYKDLL